MDTDAAHPLVRKSFIWSAPVLFVVCSIAMVGPGVEFTWPARILLSRSLSHLDRDVPVGLSAPRSAYQHRPAAIDGVTEVDLYSDCLLSDRSAFQPRAQMSLPGSNRLAVACRS